MSFPVYSVIFKPTPSVRYRRQGVRRDTSAPKRSARAAKGERVTQYRMVLRKERTIRVSRIKADHPAAAAEVAHALIGDSPFEKMLAILLDGNANVVGVVIIATNSAVSEVYTALRGVFAPAIAHNASAIVLAHNHPSGNPRPSVADLSFTRRASEAAILLGIPLMDNIIVTRDPNVWESFETKVQFA